MRVNEYKIVILVTLFLGLILSKKAMDKTIDSIFKKDIKSRVKSGKVKEIVDEVFNNDQ